jgi:hypothetical protein
MQPWHEIDEWRIAYMELLSAIALVLLTLAGYTAGNVNMGKGRKMAPYLPDIIIVTGLWAGALMTRSMIGKWWALLVWLLIGAAVGALHMALRRGYLPPLKKRGAPEDPPKKGFMGAMRDFTAPMGEFQGRILMIFFYFILVTPFGLLARAFSDPLKLGRNREHTFWSPRADAADDIERVRRQY